MTINDTKFGASVDEAALLASALCNVSLNEQKEEAIDSMLDNLITYKDTKNLKVRLLVYKMHYSITYIFTNRNCY